MKGFPSKSNRHQRAINNTFFPFEVEEAAWGESKERVRNAYITKI